MRKDRSEDLGRRDGRSRRVVTGLHVLAAVLLMTAVVVLANALAARVPLRVQLASRARHALSEKTLSMLRGLDTRIEITALFDGESRLYDDVRALLQEYELAAERLPSLELKLEVVDPRRDIARTRELARMYGIDGSDRIVFTAGDKRKIIDINSLAQYEVELSESGIARRMIGFLGEQAFSSAILNITEPTTPVVYFLTGHGERRVDDFSRQGGYSTIARVIGRDNFEVRPLAPGTRPAIPDDCRALVIAGPNRRLSEMMIGQVDDYLMNRHGRVLLLLDPGPETGLEGVLERWGIKAGRGVVAGLTFSGRELVVSAYGDHPITRHFRNMTTMFYLPLPLLRMDPATPPGDERRNREDRVRVTLLAGAGPEGWIETDPEQSPPAFDPGVDTRGPVAVAMAAERGAIGINAELPPTRLVVIGDSHFVSNAAISSGVGGNVSFLMAALNWLVERDSLLTVGPRVPSLLQPELTDSQWNRMFGGMVFGIPGLLAIFGMAVARRRR